MDRRQFLVRSLQGSLAVYFSSLGRSVLGQPNVSWALPGGALNPVSAFLTDYQIPGGPFDPTRNQTLRFDVLRWDTPKGRQKVSIETMGTLSLERQIGVRENVVQYTARQSLNSGEYLETQVSCVEDPWRSVKEWRSLHRLESSTNDLSVLTRISEQGVWKDGHAKITRGGEKRTLPCPCPLVCRWGLMDSGSGLRQQADWDEPLAFLHEPTGIKRDQRLSILTSQEPDAGIYAYLQHGPGTLPTHWVFDEDHRPLFVTTFLLSWALREVS